LADHLDVPGVVDLEGHLIGSPNMDPRVDITDVYAFAAKKEDDEEENGSSRTVLILNVNPLTLAPAFNPDAIYEVLVDTNADAIPDITFKTKFSAVSPDGRQRATVVRAVGADAESRDFSGSVIIKNARVSFDEEARTKKKRGYKFFAGLRSDPFFFDLLGFFATPINFTGSDFFADKNVFGIVLEVPNSALGTTPDIGVWSRILIPSDGGMLQVDRMGRPAINTVFNKGTDKVTFNNIEPTSDRALFLAKFEAVLGSFGYDASGAEGVAKILLPDILTFNFTNTAGFLNGRNLTDDVIDISLNLVTKGALTTDKVGPHADLLDEFPYLGEPHGVGESDDD